MTNRTIGFLVLYSIAMVGTFVFPQIGVWGFLFESNYHPPFNRYWGAVLMSITYRWSFWIGAAMILSVALHWNRFPKARVFEHPQTVLLILFTINCFVVTLWAHDVERSRSEAFDNLKWLLVFVCIIRTHSDPRWLPIILYIYVFAAIDAGWDATMDPKSGRFVRGGPVTACFDENFVSGHMVALLAFVGLHALSPSSPIWLRCTFALGAP